MEYKSFLDWGIPPGLALVLFGCDARGPPSEVAHPVYVFEGPTALHVSEVVMVLFFSDFILKFIVLKMLVSQFLSSIHIFKLFDRREHALMREHEWVFSPEVRRTFVIPQIHAEVHRGLRARLIKHVRELG